MVSIIMPVKNASPFLVMCLDSFLNQTHQDWELIAVNDHSTDDSSKILDSYSAKDERITVLHNTGGGIIDALSLGYKSSSGDYISRMDADDIMVDRKIEALWLSFKGDSHEHVATGMVNYFGDGDELGPGYRRYEQWLAELCRNNRHYKEIYKECVIPSPCWMMKRETFDRIGGFEVSVYPEDYDLVFRLYKHQIEVKPIVRLLHYWRDHANRASRTDENYADNSFLEMKIRYFLELDYDSSRTLTLWGAGKKGKRAAQLLLGEKIDFDWICENPNKIGKEIYGKVLHGLDGINESSQLIILVANPKDQEDIRKRLAKTQNIQAFWFC